jgi:hypothetical protein
MVDLHGWGIVGEDEHITFLLIGCTGSCCHAAATICISAARAQGKYTKDM